MTIDDLLHHAERLTTRANAVANERLSVQKDKLALCKALHEYLRQPALTVEEKVQRTLIQTVTEAIEGLNF